MALELNDARNVGVHGCAVAAESGERTLYAHEASSMWTLVPEMGRPDGVTVECRTLDELARDLEPPDLVKIDVDGGEVDAFRGELELLGHRRPTLVVEFSDDAALAEGHELLPWYTFARLGEQRWLLSPRVAELAQLEEADRRTPPFRTARPGTGSPGKGMWLSVLSSRS